MTKILKLSQNSPARWSASTSDPVIDKLLSFRELREGWHFGSGAAINEDAISAAWQLVLTLKGKASEGIEVFPSISGGVVVSGFWGSDTLDVTCRADGLYNVLRERQDDEVSDLEGIDRNSVEDVVRDILWSQNRSSGYFIQNITATNEVVSIVKRSNRLTMGPRSSTQSVQLTPPAVNAATL